MGITTATFWFAAAAAVIAAEESTTASDALVPKEADYKDQTAASSYLVIRPKTAVSTAEKTGQPGDNNYLNLGSVSSGLLSSDAWKPITGPSSQQALDSGADTDIKTITLTKQVPVPYPVTVEKRVPVRVEVPVDKPYPVYVPRPYHVLVEKKVPYHVAVPVPQPYTVERHVPVPVRVAVDKPVPVPVPHPFPVVIYKKVPYTVERQVPYPVKVPYFRHYPVHIPIEKHVPVPVEKAVPFPVHVPVERPVPVPVEKPVPYPVEKLVAVPVEKIVPVPFKVPVKVHVKVPVPQPVISHYHEASGSQEQYTATDHSQQNHHSYQVEGTREEASNAPQAEYSEVYAQTGQNQWAQLGPNAHHQSETSPYNGLVRFPQGNDEGSSATNLAVQQGQENIHRQVGTNIKVGQGDVQGQYAHGQPQSHDGLTHHYPEEGSHGQTYGPVHLDHPQLHQQHVSGSFRQQHDGGNEQPHAGSQNDIAEFEKRLKDRRQESYSKFNMGPTLYSTAIRHV